MNDLCPKLTCLDKTVPFFKIVLRMDGPLATAMHAPTVPSGYALRPYAKGDVDSWAAIETAVGEFTSCEAAKRRFEKEFLPFEGDIPGRMVFAVDGRGEPCGTACAWRVETAGEILPIVHWVGVCPKHQGRGLGRALTVWTIRQFQELHPGKAVYLRTQTWSHRAIGMYLRMGFRPIDEDVAEMRGDNEYSKARPVMATVVPQETFALFSAAGGESK